MKRQRGRGRKPGGGGGGGNNNHNHGNRSLESSGPEVKIRGTAAQIYEKYAQYARDAQSGGDRVKYEALLQHAEHYYRVMAASMPRDRLLAQQNGDGLWDEERFTATGFPRVFYLRYHGYRKFFPLWAVALAGYAVIGVSGSSVSTGNSSPMTIFLTRL